MTHFIGAVLVPASVTPHANTRPTAFPTLYGKDAKEWVPGTELNDYLNEALERFNEGREVSVWQPKAGLIEKERKRIERFRDDTYAEYLALGLVGYTEKYPHTLNNPAHLKYLREEFPLMLEWTDEEIYTNKVIAFEEPEDVRESDGAIHTTYNPHSKWDWWTIGGRWEQQYRDKQLQKVSVLRQALADTLVNIKDPEAQAELAAVEAEIAVVEEDFRNKRGNLTWDDLDAVKAKRHDCKAYLPWWFPYSLVTKETELATDETTNELTGYEWHTQGRMGWFGMSAEDYTPEQWVEKLIEILADKNEDDYLVYIDFHL